MLVVEAMLVPIVEAMPMPAAEARPMLIARAMPIVEAMLMVTAELASPKLDVREHSVHEPMLDRNYGLPLPNQAFVPVLAKLQRCQFLD